MYTIPEQNIYKLPDGKIWKGVPADLPSSAALKAPAKKAPAKKAEPAKAKAQEPVENKAAKVEKEDK